MSKSIWTINGRFASQRMTGVQRYAYEIVIAMDALLRDQKTFADQLGLELTLPPKAKNVPELRQMATRSTTLMSGHAWDQLILPLVQRSGVLSLGNFGPIFARRHIVCIHDANTFIQPDSYSRTFQLAYRSLLPLIGKYASRVATVSQFSADMLVKYQVCRPEQIFVAPNGHEHALRWDASKSALALCQNLKRPYILLLGSKAKHKNIEIVLRQAAVLDAAGVDIVVVGAGANIFGTDVPDIQSPNIHYTGFVGDDELAALYEGALCLTFPSRTEGFGIPPLEAMTRGCPVIAANVAALVEVGGDAVLYADPDQAGQWRDAILTLLGNAELRASLIARGRKRAGLFSWKRSAEIYLDEIMKLETRNL